MFCFDIGSALQKGFRISLGAWLVILLKACFERRGFVRLSFNIVLCTVRHICSSFFCDIFCFVFLVGYIFLFFSFFVFFFLVFSGVLLFLSCFFSTRMIDVFMSLTYVLLLIIIDD